MPRTTVKRSDRSGQGRSYQISGCGRSEAVISKNRSNRSGVSTKIVF